ALPARAQIVDDLVRRADERVGARENLVGHEPRPAAGRQLLGRLAAIVGDDHPLHERVQLEPVESIGRRLAHEAHTLVHAGRTKARDVRLPAALSERDPGETDDVGFARGQREEARGIAADEHGWPRALDGAWMDRVTRHAIVPARERDGLTFEQTLDDD